MTVKSWPDVRAEGCALTVVPDFIVMEAPPMLPIGVPLARAAVNPTVPKLVSGRTPAPLEGASAMISAECFLALARVLTVVFDQPWVASDRTRVYRLPAAVTEALM